MLIVDLTLRLSRSLTATMSHAEPTSRAATDAAADRSARLDVQFGRQRVLRDINLTIPRGQTLVDHRRKRLRQDGAVEDA